MCHGAAVGRLDRLHDYLVLDVFFSLSGLSESVYKATLPHFLFFFFLLSCLIFLFLAT